MRSIWCGNSLCDVTHYLLTYRFDCLVTASRLCPWAVTETGNYVSVYSNNGQSIWANGACIFRLMHMTVSHTICHPLRWFILSRCQILQTLHWVTENIIFSQMLTMCCVRPRAAEEFVFRKQDIVVVQRGIRYSMLKENFYFYSVKRFVRTFSRGNGR